MRIIKFDKKIFKTLEKNEIYFFRVNALINEQKKTIEMLKIFLFCEGKNVSLIDFNEFYQKVKIEDETELLKLTNKAVSSFFEDLFIITSSKEKALEISEHASNLIFLEFKKELEGWFNGQNSR